MDINIYLQLLIQDPDNDTPELKNRDATTVKKMQ